MGSGGRGSASSNTAVGTDGKGLRLHRQLAVGAIDCKMAYLPIGWLTKLCACASDPAPAASPRRSPQNTLAGELRQLQAAAGPVKCAAAYLNKDAGWPRVAFTLRGGKVLHSSACGNMDTSKCTTFEYFSAEDLEGYMQREGCVLCHTCRADPRF